ncbi:MAG: PepSY domain-containing protein [Dethiosulfatibacter sp.]|nr:PepSY domain-containing protein [Dethiosulfatibacter sp.]
MKKNKIEQYIYSAIDKAPVDLFSNIKSQSVNKMESHDFITRQNNHEDSKRYWKPIMAFSSMAAVFLLVFIGWWSQYNPIDSVIYLDVNPSIQVSIDKNEKVIDLKTLKSEDKDLIANIDYKDKDLYWVTEQLLDVLIAQGYIDTSHHTMLVSVLNENPEIGSKQSIQLNSSIREHLQKQSIKGVVLRQAISKSNTVEDFARDYEISVGKMTFIRNLIILDPDLKVEELSVLSLEQLVGISAKTGLDIKRIIEVDQGLDELYQDEFDDDHDDDSDTDDDDDEVDDDDNDYDDDSDSDDDYDDDYDDDSDTDDDNDDDDYDEIDDDSDDFDEGILPGQVIGQEKAIEIALGLTGGGVVEDIELNEDDTYYTYEIEIVKDGMEYDVKIDASSGKILEFEIED